MTEPNHIVHARVQQNYADGKLWTSVCFDRPEEIQALIDALHRLVKSADGVRRFSHFHVQNEGYDKNSPASEGEIYFELAADLDDSDRSARREWAENAKRLAIRG